MFYNTLIMNKELSQPTMKLPFERKVVLIFKLYILQLKTLLKMPTMVFITFFMPIIILLGMGVLLAEADLFVGVFGLPIILIVGIIFGYLYYSSSSSTLDKNFRLTKMNPRIINASIFFVILTICFFSSSFEFIVMIVFTSFNIIFSYNWPFMKGHFTVGDSLIINWSNLPWLMIVYYWLMTILLSFTFFAMFRIIIKDNQTFSMLVFSYFIYSLFFAHVAVATFNRFNWENGQLWSRDYFNDGVSSIKYDSFSDYASLLTPQNFLNQTFFSMFWSGATHIDPSAPADFHIPAHYNFFNWSEESTYNYALILPYCYLVGMYIISFVLQKD